jgi:hypothetical protein
LWNGIQGNGMGTAWERHVMFESAFNVTICYSKLAANQKAVAKQSAFSRSWQAAVGWL